MGKGDIKEMTLTSSGHLFGHFISFLGPCCIDWSTFGFKCQGSINGSTYGGIPLAFIQESPGGPGIDGGKGLRGSSRFGNVACVWVGGGLISLHSLTYLCPVSICVGFFLRFLHSSYLLVFVICCCITN